MTSVHNNSLVHSPSQLGRQAFTFCFGSFHHTDYCFFVLYIVLLHSCRFTQDDFPTAIPTILLSTVVHIMTATYPTPLLKYQSIHCIDLYVLLNEDTDIFSDLFTPLTIHRKFNLTVIFA